ncbi:MAG: hypothetical protein HY341_02465 [Candidatus Kerfeldbacteria bacterium]|nr:hypothetical protein [Candidatus Kerfeldbacteria bacterium]
MDQRTQKQSKKRSGFKTTAAIAAAAALVIAGISYVRSRAENRQKLATVKKQAKSAGTVLTGQAREAYNEIRLIVREELTATGRPPSKHEIERAIDRSLKAIKVHGSVTKAELTALGTELKRDWKSFQRGNGTTA